MQVEEEMHQATVTIPSQDEMTLLGTLARANGEDLLHAIGDSVVPYPKPAVFISGGLDSTILLHHLLEKSDEEVTWGHRLLADGHNDLKAERLDAIGMIRARNMRSGAARPRPRG